MSILGGLIGGIGGYFGQRAAAKANRQAQEQSLGFMREGREQFNDGTLMNTYAPGGARAFEARQALLGLGGDRAAAEDGFENYRNSTGFQFALDTGMDAITGNRAARGVLDSGRTGSQLMEFGSNLGRRSFDNYLGTLMQDSQMGFNAGQTEANVATGQASNMANIAQRGGAAVGAANSGALGNLAVGLGSAADSGMALAQKRGWF